MLNIFINDNSLNTCRSNSTWLNLSSFSACSSTWRGSIPSFWNILVAILSTFQLKQVYIAEHSLQICFIIDRLSRMSFCKLLTGGWSSMLLAFLTRFLQASKSSLLFSRIFLSLIIFFISPSRNLKLIIQTRMKMLCVVQDVPKRGCH